MAQEKLSVTVPEALADFVDSYRAAHDVRTKSEVVERALRLLREQELAREYADAAHEVDPAWEVAAADGLANDDWS